MTSKMLFVDVSGFAVRRFRLPLIRELVGRGCHVTVASPHFDDEDRGPVMDAGADIRTYQLQRTGLNPLADLESKRSLTRLFESVGPELVICRAAKPVAHGLPMAARVGIPRRIGFMTGLGAMFYPRTAGETMTAAVGRRLITRGLKSATQVWVLNEDNESRLRNSASHLRAKSIINLDSDGVDTTAFTPHPLPEKTTFGFIGRLLPAKGARTFINAAVRMKQSGSSCRFLVAGEPDDHRDSIQKQEIHTLMDAGVIEYEGFVKDIGDFLARCSALVLPSHHEGRSRSILESLACGRPVLTTDAPGCHDAIEDGREGYVTRVGDVEGLVSRMQSIDQDPSMLESMSIASRRLAESRYEIELVTNRMADQVVKASS